ncbi:hypothetical protein FACS189499_02410 [Clostridia bacterium]|nr:hypothetical protein FACS189499_02410 [Clostridia bacterium]
MADSYIKPDYREYGENSVEPLLLSSAGISPPESDMKLSLAENRERGYACYSRGGEPLFTVSLIAFNRIEKTRYCVECLLKYTSEYDYDLILIDNGSDDGTYELFQSVAHPRKRFIRVDKNIGMNFPMQAANLFGNFRGQFFVSLANDVYLTKNWLSSIARCIETDKTIGLILPRSTNTSNYQTVNIQYSSWDDFQQKAADFNKTNPSLWEERMRLVTPFTIFTRRFFDLVGSFDYGYFHDFAEDDLSIRCRRAGLKNILCGDTIVAHDDNTTVQTQARLDSLEYGRAAYKKKWGVDAWDDIINYEFSTLGFIENASFPEDRAIDVLSVDCRCGTPVLEIRNILRRRGITDVKSYAFTTKAKYYTDLLTTGADVVADRIEFLEEFYKPKSLDIIFLGEVVNQYKNPVKLLTRLHKFLRPGGVLLWKLRNFDNLQALFAKNGYALDLGETIDAYSAAAIPFADFIETINKTLRKPDITIGTEKFSLGSEELLTQIRDVLHKIDDKADDELLKKLLVKEYCFGLIKEKG